MELRLGRDRPAVFRGVGLAHEHEAGRLGAPGRFRIQRGAAILEPGAGVGQRSTLPHRGELLEKERHAGERSLWWHMRHLGARHVVEPVDHGVELRVQSFNDDDGRFDRFGGRDILAADMFAERHRVAGGVQSYEIVGYRRHRRPPACSAPAAAENISQIQPLGERSKPRRVRASSGSIWIAKGLRLLRSAETRGGSRGPRAAILAADFLGYSRLMGRDDSGNASSPLRSVGNGLTIEAYTKLLRMNRQGYP